MKQKLKIKGNIMTNYYDEHYKEIKSKTSTTWQTTLTLKQLKL